ncbi:hypothetical protein HY639_01300 [Candidatus Woesearchaeota archaeon]|nr:hypothetical protein [Candidatus Woesearchaeota archaeon]
MGKTLAALLLATTLSSPVLAEGQKQAKIPEEVLKQYKVERLEVYPTIVRGYVTGGHLKETKLAKFFIGGDYHLWEGPIKHKYKGGYGTWMADYRADGVVDEIFWQLVPNERCLFVRDTLGTWHAHWSQGITSDKNTQAFGEDMQRTWDLYWTLLDMDKHVKR